jgi:hypothetical protein
MPTTITFFPVDNGDMTLIKFGDLDATTLLIDVNIRQDADDPGKDVRDVAKDLRERLKKDENGWPYVDAFLLSHPDQDHCRGLTRHFHLGPLDKYPDDKKDDKDKKIVIREMWSSPIVFRREDIDGKTDDLTSIVRKVDTRFSTINGKSSAFFSAFLLAPLDAKDDEEEEASLDKNHSSVILNITLAADAQTSDGAKFLTGGDAEVFIWNRQWQRHKAEAELLEYDIMQAPHHCSWHSLSEDSWSDYGEKAKLDADARKALSQTRDGAVIVASCKPIADDDSDPPCIRAKREYVAIVDEAKGEFYCTGEYPSEKSVEPLVFTVTAQGVQPPSKKESGLKAAAVVTSARTPMPHGAS